MGALIVLLFLTPLACAAIRPLVQNHSPLLRWFPPYWFLGLYLDMLPGQPADPQFHEMALRAQRGLAVTAGAFALTYLVGYRRHSRRVMESVEGTSGGPGWLRRKFDAGVNRWLLPHPLERATFHFISNTMLRNPKQRLFLATYGGIAVAHGAPCRVANRRRAGCADVRVPIPTGLLSVPLTLSFFTVSGLRAAFNFPAELRANWIFQITENEARMAHVRAVRKWMVVMGIVPLFALLGPVEIYFRGWGQGLIHLTFALGLSLVLLNLLLVWFRKIPFTCSYFPGKTSMAVVMVFVYLAGFSVYIPWTMADLEAQLLSDPWKLALAYILMSAALYGVHRLERLEIDTSDALIFEDEPRARRPQPGTRLADCYTDSVLLPQLLLTLILLVVCCFAPGFLFVRRLRWSGLEKLCGSVGLSLVLLWLGAWAMYVFSIPSGHAGFGILCGAAAIAGAKDTWLLFRNPRVRRAVLGFAFLLAWTLVILAIIRNYSGAGWANDWLEHFQRTLYFLHRFPTGTPVFGYYLLPARPPMMNVLAAFFLGVTADRFEIFQLVFAFLNLLVFLPCCLMLPVVAKVRRIRILPLLGIFAMNPAIMQNATYTWTKSLTAFYVILAVYLYLSAWRKRDALRMTAVFVALAAGLLVHYSAGPYCVFFALHYLVVVWRTRPGKVREFVAIALASGVLMLTWFGWSIATYGAKITFGSNTSVNSPTPFKGSAVEKISGNIFDSVVPRVLWDQSAGNVLQQPYAPANLADYIFIVYQTNLIFSMGLAGGPLVVWSVITAFRRKQQPASERKFWAWLIASVSLVGLAVVGERDLLGAAHLTLIPIEVLGLTLLASRASIHGAGSPASSWPGARSISPPACFFMHAFNIWRTPSRPHISPA